MEQTAPFETITKLEAAERQLRVAIRMFFERRDMIAVHTLAAAALQVLDDLARKHGNIERSYGRLYERYPPETAKEIMKALREAQGFFKHADKDPPGKVLRFYPEATKFYLAEAAHIAYEITGRLSPESQALFPWLLVAHPDLFQLDPELQVKTKQWFNVVKPDDFEFILYCIDHP